MRILQALCVAVVIGAVAVGQAAGQQTPPTVTVQASPTAVTIGATGPLPAGPTRFDFVRAAGAPDVSVYVLLLVPGFSADDVLNELALEDQGKSQASLGMVSVQASASISGDATHQALTFTIKPGLTYVVFAEPDGESNGKVKPRAVTTFTSSTESNGATSVPPDATVRLEGLRFRGAAKLPLDGTVRFENRDSAEHIAIAFPLRPGVTRKRLGKAIRSSSQAAFGKILAGEPLTAQNVLSGGNSANDQELRFPKKGRYGLVCFIDGHDRLGMYRVVTVR